MTEEELEIWNNITFVIETKKSLEVGANYIKEFKPNEKEDIDGKEV